MIKLLTYTFFSCLLLTSCFPKEQNEKADAEAIKVVIADRTFKVPIGYLDGAKAIGKDTESIVLEYSLPNFEILPRHPQERAARQQLIKEGRKRGMLLEAQRNRPSFDVSVANHMRIKNLIKQPSEAYGLEKYIYEVPESLANQTNRKPYIHDDFLIERNDDGSVISYLRCSPPGKHKVPSCRHRFIDKGIIFNTHWRIQDLANWQAQREAAIKFIDSLEVNHDQEGAEQ